MKKLAALLLLLATPALADSGPSNAIRGRLNVTYGTPIPGTGNPAGVCPAEVCADGEVLAYVLADECFECIPASSLDPWTAGTNGLYYAGDGVIVGDDVAFCAASGGAGDLRVADDLEVAGGSFWYCATLAVLADTSDGADNMFYTMNGGGASQDSSRGAYIRVSGNEEASFPGDVSLWAGDNSSGSLNFITTASGTNNVIQDTIEDGANDNFFIRAATGFFFLPESVTPPGISDDSVYFGKSIDLIMEGNTVDSFTTTFGAAAGIAASTTFRTPATNGASGDVLTGNGSGQSSWTTLTATGSATVNFGSTSATTVDSSDIAVTGADLGDQCMVATDLAATWVTGAAFTCYVSSAGNVKVRFAAAGAGIDPGSDTFRVRVFDP